MKKTVKKSKTASELEESGEFVPKGRGSIQTFFSGPKICLGISVKLADLFFHTLKQGHSAISSYQKTTLISVVSVTKFNPFQI